MDSVTQGIAPYAGLETAGHGDLTEIYGGHPAGETAARRDFRNGPVSKRP